MLIGFAAGDLVFPNVPQEEPRIEEALPTEHKKKEEEKLEERDVKESVKQDDSKPREISTSHDVSAPFLSEPQGIRALLKSKTKEEEESKELQQEENRESVSLYPTVEYEQQVKEAEQTGEVEILEDPMELDDKTKERLKSVPITLEEDDKAVQHFMLFCILKSSRIHYLLVNFTNWYWLTGSLYILWNRQKSILKYGNPNNSLTECSSVPARTAMIFSRKFGFWKIVKLLSFLE